MGDGEVRKKFINALDDLVDDCLRGLVLGDDQLEYHPVSRRFFCYFMLVFLQL